MATRNIVKIGDPILRAKCREVNAFDDRLGQLIDDMTETMFKAEGVGLAAPQVGILKRVCVVCIDGETVYELVNPVIVRSSGSQIGPEGCLSIPGRSGEVERPKKIVVEAFTRNGEKARYKVEGFAAVAFCHEIDHLDGIMYIDKMINEDFQ
mgnify:FL=1